MENHDLVNFGREIGWLQATCAYAEMKYLSFARAENGLTAILQVIKKRHREEVAGGSEKLSTYVIKTMREEAFKAYPSCRKYWPTDYF